MTTELWLTYVQTSRGDKPCTAQLIDLNAKARKMCDLEDLLEHVYDAGFLDPKYRPVSWWERFDGSKLKGSATLEEVVHEGVGVCETTALRLVIADAPPAVWLSYVYLHHGPGHRHATQRIKLHEPTCAGKLVLIAHLTNHVFAKGYLPCHLRSKVYWKGPCGRPIHEHERIEDVLVKGEGCKEESALQLIVDF